MLVHCLPPNPMCSVTSLVARATTSNRQPRFVGNAFPHALPWCDQQVRARSERGSHIYGCHFKNVPYTFPQSFENTMLKVPCLLALAASTKRHRTQGARRRVKEVGGSADARLQPLASSARPRCFHHLCLLPLPDLYSPLPASLLV